MGWGNFSGKAGRKGAPSLEEFQVPKNGPERSARAGNRRVPPRLNRFFPQDPCVFEFLFDRGHPGVGFRPFAFRHGPCEWRAGGIDFCAQGCKGLAEGAQAGKECEQIQGQIRWMGGSGLAGVGGFQKVAQVFHRIQKLLVGGLNFAEAAGGVWLAGGVGVETAGLAKEGLAQDVRVHTGARFQAQEGKGGGGMQRGGGVAGRSG